MLIPAKMGSLEKRKLLSKVVALCHDSSVRLVGRIWGKVLRKRSKEKRKMGDRGEARREKRN
jgi:hypothetical protein